LDTIRGALAAQEARDLAATERVGETPYGCDTSEHLADLLLQARARIAELKAALLASGIAGRNMMVALEVCAKQDGPYGALAQAALGTLDAS
jgi:hypothetical protein